MIRTLFVLISFGLLSCGSFCSDGIPVQTFVPPNTPYIVGTPQMNIYTDDFTTVIIKISSNRDVSTRLFFATSFDPQFNEPKSISFEMKRSDRPKEYIFNVRAQNKYWQGFVKQFIIFPEGGPNGISVESFSVNESSFFTSLRSGIGESMQFEPYIPRSVNFIYGPKINGRSVNAYIYVIVLLFMAILFTVKVVNSKEMGTSLLSTAKGTVILLCVFWVLLDLRLLLDNYRMFRLDQITFAGKSLDAKRGLTVAFPDYYNFIAYCGSKVPSGSPIALVHPSNYYYSEKAAYYLFPTYISNEPEYVLIYDPENSMTEKINGYYKSGFKFFAKFKDGELVLRK